MRPVFEKPVSKISPSELQTPLGHANSEREASELMWDAQRRHTSRTPKPKEFQHAEHPSGVSGFFPKK